MRFALRVSGFLMLTIAPEHSALAGCEALSLCGKTVDVHIETNGWVAYSSRGAAGGGSAVEGNIKIYVANNGNVFITGTGTGVTNKLGDSFVGTLCSEAGSKSVEMCPGTKSCRNVTKNSADHTYRSTSTTYCKVRYASDGFVLETSIVSDSEQQMRFGGRTEYQSVKQHGTQEAHYTVSGNSCSYFASGTYQMETHPTWMEATIQTNKSSSRSLSCQILTGRQL